MRKFNVGDRVRVISATNPQMLRFVGQETTIIRKSAAYVGAWALDFPDESFTPVANPEQLRHVYDGNEKVSWSSCIWKPTGVKNNAVS